MAEIYPFRGIRYNPSIVKDLSSVVCPPYDIITPQLEQELYNRSQYNFIRIEHNQRLPQDSPLDNKYTRSAAILDEWLKQKVLIADETPAIYIHDHYFIYQGKECRRRGLIARVRLEEWHKNIIRPHEGTLAEPKDDRVSLLWALRANTSPVLALFEDQTRQVSSLFTTNGLSKPVISINNSDEERHNVWAITEPRIINRIYDFFAEKPLYIADGHHRYESALIYQREQHTLSSTSSENEAFNFVMMTLVDFADPGLVILPPYRLLRGLSPSKIANLITKLQLFFDTEELSLNMPGVWQTVDDILLKANKTRLVLYGLVAEKLLVLSLRDSDAAKKMMPYFHSELYKELDVSVVDHVILEELLGLSGSEDEAKISYNYDIKETVSRVLAHEYQLALILRPIKAEVIKAVADVSDRMPRKSTYFYPKLPSGLVLNRLV